MSDISITLLLCLGDNSGWYGVPGVLIKQNIGKNRSKTMCIIWAFLSVSLFL